MSTGDDAATVERYNPKPFEPEWLDQHAVGLIDRNRRALALARASTGELATRIELILTGRDGQASALSASPPVSGTATREDVARELPAEADSQAQCVVAEVLHEDDTLVWGAALIKAQQVLDRLLALGAQPAAQPCDCLNPMCSHRTARAAQPADGDGELRARIQALIERAENFNDRYAMPLFDGSKFPATVTTADLRRALDGDTGQGGDRG